MVTKTDGRGLLSGTYSNTNHSMDQDVWLHDTFPQWGRYLNLQIEHAVIPKGQIGLWWCGGSSWVLKTDEGGTFWIDMFTGGSGYTEQSSCGVCRQSGAESMNWLTLTPGVINPWEFGKLDGCMITHVHQDHCDVNSIKAINQTKDTNFYGPKVVAKRLNEFETPVDRIHQVTVGDVVEIPGGRVRVLPCYDDTAIRTGGAAGLLDYEDACVCFLFETSGGNVLFMGDTWYNDAYAYFPRFFDIDLAIFDMGFNWPGATDKMTPYDCVRMGMALQCKTMIPDHYDNLAHTAYDPMFIVNQFERLAQEMTPDIKTIIMQIGGMILYPKDKNVGHYRYPNGSIGVDVTRISGYQKLAAKFHPKETK
ncbi:MAG: ascorbate 6-phosphate lactonase [Firmicutes bacterium]|nr:ascorbate 6-phosphate lactonase [Bacillota bacterium]